ncbi:MAG: DUF47 family protein [Clostridia bacterium]|nr:DUF47 family protein [Clostridia bacterium]
MFLKNDNSKIHNLVLEQIKDVEGCLLSYTNFLKGAVNPDTDIETLRSLSVGVNQLENAADRSLRAMIDSLSSSLLPATRSEMIEIGSSCDNIANKCQQSAKKIVLTKFHFPKEYADDIMKINSIVGEEFQLLVKAIGLLFTNFGELLKDHSILDDIRAKEHEVDVIEDNLYELIYAKEEMRLSERTQIAEMVELTCDLADIIEDIADKIQIMLITRKA